MENGLVVEHTDICQMEWIWLFKFMCLLYFLLPYLLQVILPFVHIPMDILMSQWESLGPLLLVSSQALASLSLVSLDPIYPFSKLKQKIKHLYTCNQAYFFACLFKTQDDFYETQAKFSKNSSKISLKENFRKSQVNRQLFLE